MISKNRFPIILLLAVAALFLAGCSGIPNLGPGLVIGDNYRLASGQTLNSDLTVIGGNATLDTDSTVNGNVVLIGGNGSIDGKVNGDVSVMGGYAYLDDNAVIQGNVDSVGGTVQRSSHARVEGKVTTNKGVPPVTTVQTPAMNVSFDPITAPLMAVFQSLAMAALAIVINLFAPRPMERTGQAATTQPAASGGVGCLTILVLLVMAITIILLPFSLVGFLAVAVAAIFGWVALGLVVGRRLAAWLKQSWTDPVSAGAGTLALTLLAGLLNIIPCIGWVGSFIVGMIAIGAVVLTRFGTQGYPPPYTSAPAPQPGPYTPPPPVTGSDAPAPQNGDI